jgi:hypothetical protein
MKNARATRTREGADATLKALRRGPAGLNELTRRTGFGKDKQRRLVNLLCASEDVEFHETTKEGNKCHQYSLTQGGGLVD